MLSQGRKSVSTVNGGEAPASVVEADAVTHENAVAGSVAKEKTGERNERSDH